LLVLPDEVHGFLRYESWKKIFQRSADFLYRKLPR
jgi:dipeptidyl aminopeptidase/acylaminoacyl peptidase